MKRKTYRLIVSLIILTLMATIAGCSSPAEEPASSTPPPDSENTETVTSSGPVVLDLATFNMGTGWYAYGSFFSELMMDELPAGSQVNIIPEAGAAANPILVSNGRFPIALGFNQANNWAYNGLFIYDEQLDNLRGLVGYLDTYYYAAMVSKNFGITDLAEIAEKQLPIRVSTVPIGGTGEVVTRLIFEYYGFTYDDIRAWGGRVEHNDFGTIVDMFKDGQTDFFLQNITQGHPAITELAITTDVLFLEFPEEMIDAFVAEYGFSRETLPANSFNGQTEDIKSMGLTTTLFTNTDLPDDIAYAITKAIVENPEYLHSGHVALQRFSPEDAADPIGNGIPLHPGAEAYYRDAGLLN